MLFLKHKFMLILKIVQVFNQYNSGKIPMLAFFLNADVIKENKRGCADVAR
jgi:hypothetical protein